MNFSFFKHIGESEVKFLWYLYSIGGSVSITSPALSDILKIDQQQLRRTTNKLRDKGFIEKQMKRGRGNNNSYKLITLSL